MMMRSFVCLCCKRI